MLYKNKFYMLLFCPAIYIYLIMSQFSFKGDLESLSDKQLDVICKTLERMNFKGNDVYIEPLGKAGDNYASDVKTIKIKTDDTETFNVIAKLNPNLGNDNGMKFVTSYLFSNEITIYTEVLPMMANFQKTSGVSMDNIIRYPICYGTSQEKEHEVILLEDLSKEKYVMLDKLKPLTHNTIKLILKDLAQFHSLSYALRNSQPETFIELLKKFTDLNTIKELKDQQQTFLEVLGENFSKMFDKQIYKKIVIETLRNNSKILSKLIASDTGSKYTVILHGDSWTNNMLFKLKDGTPEKCVLIDYQLARESLPVSDILYLVFNCTDYKTRSNHFNEWIDYYHLQLEENLFHFGLRVTNVYPRDKLDSDLKRYAKAYLGFAMLVLSLLLRQTEESAVVKEAMVDSDMDTLTDSFKVTHLQEESVSKIKERFEGLIDTCIDFGYINGN